MRLVLVLAAMTMGLLAYGCADSAAAGTTGWIVDAKCADTGKSGAAHSECAKTCIENGEAAVLVTEDGTVHKISNQDKATPLAGQQVTVTFSEAGGAIEIETIEAKS